MYAVIALGGKQYRVTPGEYLVVDRLHLDEGASFEPTVLMAGDGDKVLVGADEMAKVKVSAKVKSHQKGKKIRVLRYEPKSNWSKRRGHRSYQSVIEIAKIAVWAGEKTRWHIRRASAPRRTAATPSPSGSA